MTHIAPDIVCQAPAGRLVGAQALREFMGPFAQIVTRSDLVAAFGDDRVAVLVYDTNTVSVQDAPGAECVTVVDGRIQHMRIIFDRLPFAATREAAADERASSAPGYGQREATNRPDAVESSDSNTSQPR